MESLRAGSLPSGSRVSSERADLPNFISSLASGVALPALDPSPLADIGIALRDGEASLSAEGLLALVDGRLSELDGQIGGLMLDLQERSDSAQTIVRQLEGLQAIRGAMVDRGATDPDDAVSLDTLVPWEGKRVTIGALLEGIGLDEALSTSAGSELRLGALDALVEERTLARDRASSANEGAMIRLQSLMSQRTQVIELATRMLRSISDAQAAILRNLGG